MNDLDAVRGGDRDARDRWVSEWWPRVYRMALVMTGHEADAEDLAQETLVAALDAVARFRGDSSESTWLYAILARKFRSGKRRASARPAGERRHDGGVGEALALLARLAPAQRITAALFYVEDMTVEEIARSLGVAQATVRWRLFRARRILRRELGGVPSGPVWRQLL